jgi:tetratricopeptide (TPR) repeat protein
MRQRRLRNTSWILFAGLFSLCASHSPAQQPRPTAPSTRALPQEGIFLVFPFENAGAAPRLDWIGEGLEELSIQRLSAAGQQVYSHAGRLNEMDPYGLPPTARLSRAAMLHIAQELDADYLVFGNFSSDGKELTVNARVLRVSPVALFTEVSESGPLASLMDLHAKLMWRLIGTIDHGYPISLAEFSKLQRTLSLAAFEQYIRGLLASDDEPRLRNLKEATRLEPDWPDPVFALGQVYFQRNDCVAALPFLAKVPAPHPRSTEARFAMGVCRLRLDQPDKAEEVFAELEQDLHRNLISGADLPELLNNLGLARARQDNFPPALMVLGRARDIDPDTDDYPFNLGLLALQQKDLATAETHFSEAVKRDPDNAEDRAFLIYTLDKLGKKPEVAAERESARESFGENALPLLKFDSKRADTFTKYQRVKRELDTSSLRLELEGPQMQQSASVVTAPRDGPVTHIRRGRQELHAGRLDAAEKEFRAALSTDPQNASAHRELAEVYHRRGKLDEAVHELQLSLAAFDSASVRTTLARIYLEQKKPNEARVELEKAIKLAPNNPEAKELRDRLERAKPSGGAK